MKANVLRAKIVEKGLTIGSFCKVAGFVRSTFDRKLIGTVEFDRDEIQRIIEALELSPDETRDIFFADEVA